MYTYLQSFAGFNNWIQSFALKPKEIAIKKLNQLKQGHDAEVIPQIQQTLTDYISTIIETPAKGLTLELIENQLSKKKISPELVNQLKSILEQCTYLSYAPDVSKVKESTKLCDQAITIIKKVKQ